MKRKEKAEKNAVQQWNYSLCSEAFNKNELEQLADALSFLEKFPVAPEHVQHHQRTIEELRHLLTFNLLIRITSDIWKQLSDDTMTVDTMPTDSEVDISRLYAGQIVNNFKELCSLVGFKKPDGKRQRDQYRKKFSRFFDFVELDYSNQIMILEVYEEPLVKGQNYSGKFLKEVKYIILNYLLQVANQNPEGVDTDGYYEIKTTYFKLMTKELKLISPFFGEHIEGDYLLDSFFSQNYSQYFQQSNAKYNLIVLSNRLYTKVRGAVSTALSRLSSVDEMITLEEGYEAKITSSSSGVYSWKPILSQKDRTYLTNTMKDVAYSLGYKNSWQCRWHGEQKEFETKLFERTLRDKGWSEVRFRINIGFNYMHLLKYINEFQNDGTYRKTFFTNMETALNTQAIDWYIKENALYLDNWVKYLNAVKEYTPQVSEDELWKEYETKNYYSRRYKDGFVDSQKLLAEYVVNPDDLKQQELMQFRKNWMNRKKDFDLYAGLTDEENDLFIDFEEGN